MSAINALLSACITGSTLVLYMLLITLSAEVPPAPPPRSSLKQRSLQLLATIRTIVVVLGSALMAIEVEGVLAASGIDGFINYSCGALTALLPLAALYHSTLVWWDIVHATDAQFDRAARRTVARARRVVPFRLRHDVTRLLLLLLPQMRSVLGAGIAYVGSVVLIALVIRPGMLLG